MVNIKSVNKVKSVLYFRLFSLMTALYSPGFEVVNLKNKKQQQTKTKQMFVTEFNNVSRQMIILYYEPTVFQAKLHCTVQLHKYIWQRLCNIP